MKTSLFVLSIVLASTALYPIEANAHDPKNFDRIMEAEQKPAPVTCAQLADFRNYSSDETRPEIKMLKMRCDDEKKADAKKSATTSASGRTK
jgi:hypothetical protein